MIGLNRSEVEKFAIFKYCIRRIYILVNQVVTTVHYYGSPYITSCFIKEPKYAYILNGKLFGLGDGKTLTPVCFFTAEKLVRGNIECLPGKTYFLNGRQYRPDAVTKDHIYEVKFVPFNEHIDGFIFPVHEKDFKGPESVKSKRTNKQLESIIQSNLKSSFKLVFCCISNEGGKTFKLDDREIRMKTMLNEICVEVHYYVFSNNLKQFHLDRIEKYENN